MHRKTWKGFGFAFFVLFLLICINSVFSVNVVIHPDYVSTGGDIKVYNSTGEWYYTTTWSNIQIAIDSVNGSGTVQLPEGTIAGSTDIEINEEVRLIGTGFSNTGNGGTCLDYGGTGDVIRVDGVNNYVLGCEISNIRIEANNATGINLTANAPNVITKSYFNNIYIDNCSIGIRIESLGGAQEVYRNNFENIYINTVGTGSYGIYGISGSYNSFDNVEIVGCDNNSYAIHTTLSSSDFSSISCDGIILSNGQNCDFNAITIETVPTVIADNIAFRLAGAGTTIDKLTFTDCNCTYGLQVYNAGHTISNIRGYGTDYPSYLFNVDGSSSGVAMDLHGSSTVWSNLDDDTGWTYINVNGRNWFSNSSYHRIMPYYEQVNPPTLLENTTAYWYNTSGGWLYQVSNSYGTQFYLNMSYTTY